MPKVSIIIPVYNTEKYLRKCLDSVCNQTLKDIEIICVNDCSTDDSPQILQEYAQKDSRIKIINFTQNKGVAIARNTAIDEAKGECIGFVDSDDYIDLDFYEKLYNKAVETGAEVAIGGCYIENENGTRQKNILIDNFLQQVSKNKMVFSELFTLAIYNRHLLNKYAIRFTNGLIYGEDRMLPLQSSYYTNKLSIADGTFYHYRHNNDSITKSKKMRELCRVFSRIIKWCLNL